MIRQVIVSASLIAAMAVPASGASALSCAVGETSIETLLDRHAQVFVGDVTNVVERPNEGSTATVSVVEVWKGRVLPREVGVTKSLMGSAQAWRPGTRYLIFATNEQGQLMEALCDPARPWEASFAESRPVHAVLVGGSAAPTEPARDDLARTSSPPAAAPATDGGGTPVLPFAVVGGLVVAGGALYLTRRDAGHR